MERFLLSLHGLRVCRDEEDGMLWTETKNKFIVKSLYITLELGTSITSPSSFIWKAWVQPKVGFFTWETTWGKILTLDQVQKRGRSLANRYFLCHIEEESTDHLLMHYVKTRVLWEFLFALFREYWVLL